MDNILNYIYTTLEDYPGSPNIKNIQANIPPLRSRIADLTDKIRVGYFAFDSHTPPSPAQREKTNSPSALTSPRTKRGRAIKRNIYLSPDDTSTLCEGLTEGLNGGKLFHNPACMATKHPTERTGSLLPFHAYIILPGSFVIHSLPLFSYKDFSK